MSGRSTSSRIRSAPRLARRAARRRRRCRPPRCGTPRAAASCSASAPRRSSSSSTIRMVLLLRHGSEHAPSARQRARQTDLIFIAHADGCFTWAERQVRCALGKGGVVPASDEARGRRRLPGGNLADARGCSTAPTACGARHRACRRPRSRPTTAGATRPATRTTTARSSYPIPPAPSACGAPTASTTWSSMLGYNDDPVVSGQGLGHLPALRQPGLPPDRSAAWRWRRRTCSTCWLWPSPATRWTSGPTKLAARPRSLEVDL